MEILRKKQNQIKLDYKALERALAANKVEVDTSVVKEKSRRDIRE